MPPHDGMLSGTPRPRKLSPASVRIAPATPKVATTMSEALTLGRMWRQTMRGGRRRQADQRGGARAMDEGAEDVAPELVGAEHGEVAVRRARRRRREAREQALLVRIGGREQAGQQRAERDERHRQQAEPGGGGPAQRARAAAARQGALSGPAPCTGGRSRRSRGSGSPPP